MWHTLPYILKDDLHQILMDLPATDTKGRRGQPAFAPMVARVARACLDVDHVQGMLCKGEIITIRAKCRVLPDLDKRHVRKDVVPTARFADLGRQVEQQPKQAQLAGPWELCTGPAALSARARGRRMAHFHQST